MGKISLKAKKESVKLKVQETVENTIVHQRQKELALGRWDFVIFGPSVGKPGAVMRVCVAEQMLIQKASIYIAAVGDPEHLGFGGMMSIEELTGGDVAEELHGLEVYHVSPMRPMDVMEKREAADLDRMRDAILAEFADKNIAIIETPDEAAWGISALHYLDECDTHFPDPVISAIRSRIKDFAPVFRQPGELLN